MAKLPNAVIIQDYPALDGDVFGKGRRERIGELTDLYPVTINARTFAEHAEMLAEVEVIFATWGMIHFEDRHFEAMPKLKAVFYAAGNVKAFAQPLVDRGIILVSAWEANAIPVAEMCLAQTLLSLRGYFRAVRRYEVMKQTTAKAFARTGVNGETIGLIGMGKIGTRFREQLAGYPLKVIAHDPFLTPERAAEMNVEAVSMEAVFERAIVVSNHIPDLDDTKGVIRREHFQAMREGATFIFTGRGAQVVEEDMAAVLMYRKDLTALLDVTWPEPPAEEDSLWNLPNVVISPHIGGTIGDEVSRTADLAIAEYEAWRDGRPLTHQVTADVLATMG